MRCIFYARMIPISSVFLAVISILLGIAALYVIVLIPYCTDLFGAFHHQPHQQQQLPLQQQQAQP